MAHCARVAMLVGCRERRSSTASQAAHLLLLQRWIKVAGMFDGSKVWAAGCLVAFCCLPGMILGSCLLDLASNSVDSLHGAVRERQNKSSNTQVRLARLLVLLLGLWH